jgi:hypothetical protein
MKKFTYVVILILSTGNLFSQTFPYLKFRKPTTTDNITWKFASVTSGVDAYITVVKTQNATLSAIDDSTKYPYAWNPFIKYTGTPAHATDSSYVEFNVQFKKSSNGAAQTLSTMAMTVIDCDGGLNGLNIYREMVKTSLPATSKGLLGTLISTITGGGWLTNISGTIDYSNLDTSNFLAMSQINYSNVSSYNLKVGVIGKVGGGTVRQASFYFKNFAPLTLVLPVKLINFKASSSNNQNTVNWATTSEENSNRFEIYRSVDGKNFSLAGTVHAAGNSQMVNSYSFVDQQASEANGNVFYKLKVVDNDEVSTWSSIVNVSNMLEGSRTTLGSVYPNPTKGMLNISLNGIEDSEFTVEVVDVFGKTLQSHNGDDFKTGTLSLDLTTLSNGVYFIKINNQDGTSSSTRFIRN